MSDEAAPAAIPKSDPERFALRGQPGRPIRFRRGVIIVALGCGSLSLASVTWLALRQVHPPAASGDASLAEPASGVGEAVAALPSGYGDVPRLGPPLPGDLGKPILEHQRQLAVEPDDGESQRATQAAVAERERRLAELKAARQSALLVSSAARTVAEPPSSADVAVAAVPEPAAGTGAADGDRIALDPSRDPNAQQHKSEFVRQLGEEGDVNPHPLVPAASPYMLSAGSVIAASLITGLDSDLPGLVTAQVTENVHDSATGRILLIPQGARLVGSYDSVVAFGQRRALVVWQRIILPDGSSLRLDNVPATDASGYAGLQDKLDRHTWQLLKGVVLSTLLGVGSELQFTGQGDLVEAIRQSTQQSVSRAGDQLTARSLDIQPTIRIRPGAPVRLIVHKDLILAPWQG